MTSLTFDKPRTTVNAPRSPTVVEPTLVVNGASGNEGTPSASRSNHLADEASPATDGSAPRGAGVLSSDDPSRSPVNETQLAIEEGKVHILVIGKTGCGKTTFINLAADKDLPVGEESALSPCTTTIQRAEFGLEGYPRQVVLYDIPDVVESGSQLAKAKVVPKDRSQQRAWTAVIYVIDITVNRANLNHDENYQILNELDKRDQLQELLFLVSRWPSQEDEAGLTRASSRLREYRRDYLEPYVGRGAIVHEFNKDMGNEKARAIVLALVGSTLAAKGLSSPAAAEDMSSPAAAEGMSSPDFLHLSVRLIFQHRQQHGDSQTLQLHSPSPE
ncbi:uncharacterized protein B0H18DRAFT_992246 [Fomitopsis serialis]|uniref:uncharacterized protein n=1 Tax=Fomitopsis serialis TaxID=139415 RepID=UPI0020083A46|nr:uncharacterized protein B0H18DRAFT_992246 [Neoantrodia serialis]KAH9931013.1 hypothetical protein B0H18DRAFT_992246 [Neoantrodia serialis]